MKIENLKPNIIVSGPIFPEPVQVIVATTIGESVKVIGKGLNSGQVHEPVLYRISSEEFETLDDIQFIQVPRKRSSLESEDVFLLDNYDIVYIWQGSNASVREKVVGGRVARKFDHERVGYQRELFVEEGDEPDEFTKLIDG